MLVHSRLSRLETARIITKFTQVHLQVITISNCQLLTIYSSSHLILSKVRANKDGLNEIVQNSKPVYSLHSVHSIIILNSLIIFRGPI